MPCRKYLKASVSLPGCGHITRKEKREKEMVRYLESHSNGKGHNSTTLITHPISSSQDGQGTHLSQLWLTSRVGHLLRKETPREEGYMEISDDPCRGKGALSSQVPHSALLFSSPLTHNEPTGLRHWNLEYVCSWTGERGASEA